MVTPPRRHRRSHGTDARPTHAKALTAWFTAFPSRFLRTECDRCDEICVVNEVHAT